MAMSIQKVRATRAFYYERKLISPGATVDVPKILAIELRAATKAEFVEAAVEETHAIRTEAKPAKGVTP